MLLSLLIGASIASAQAASDETILISRQSAGDGGAEGYGWGPSVSADGRYVAFTSSADNLSSADSDSWNVFVRNTKTNTTTLVSRQSEQDGGAGADGRTGSFDEPSISGDGRYVAFMSDATNLSAEDKNGALDIYVRDTKTNTTTLVNRQSEQDGGAIADRGQLSSGTGLSISGDGRYVAFSSPATNLSAVDKDPGWDIFVRDTKTNTTTLVSRQGERDGGAAADGGSWSPTISGDGRYVAFASAATNLSAVDEDPAHDIFVRDIKANTTTLVSRRSAASGGAGADKDSWNTSISGNGRYVAFDSEARNLSAADRNGALDIYVRDTKTDRTTLVSRQSAARGGAGADSQSQDPSISGNGRYVAFRSLANNLGGAGWNIFVRDTRTKATTPLGRKSATKGSARACAVANGGSWNPSISGDGRYVAFESNGFDYPEVFLCQVTAGTR